MARIRYSLKDSKSLWISSDLSAFIFHFFPRLNLEIYAGFSMHRTRIIGASSSRLLRNTRQFGFSNVVKGKNWHSSFCGSRFIHATTVPKRAPNWGSPRPKCQSSRRRTSPPTGSRSAQPCQSPSRQPISILNPTLESAQMVQTAVQ